MKLRIQIIACLKILSIFICLRINCSITFFKISDEALNLKIKSSIQDRINLTHKGQAKCQKNEQNWWHEISEVEINCRGNSSRRHLETHTSMTD